MSRKYHYSIVLNSACSGAELCYDYGQTKGIAFALKKQAAQISFQMTVQKAPAELLSGNPLFRDALKKFFLLHTVRYGCRPALKTLEIRTDTETLTLQKGDSAFPRIHTMLPDKPAALPEAWQAPEFLQYLLQFSKSKGEDDQHFSAITSFLAAQGRDYEIDRFTNLWTAMNAYYYDVAVRCRKHLEQAFGTAPLPKIAGNDACAMTLLIRLLKRQPEAPKLQTQECPAAVFRVFGDALAAMDDAEIRALYADTRGQVFCGSPSKGKLQNRYPALGGYVRGGNTGTQQELFFLLLLWFPYICRCEFLHGRRPTLLSAFSDEYELQYLHKVNIFLQCFLEEHLPQLPSTAQYEPGLLAECYIRSLKSRDERQQADALLHAMQ